MEAAELADAPRAEWREPESHDAVIVRIGVPIDEARPHRAIDEPDRAVMPQLQACRDVADGRA